MLALLFEKQSLRTRVSFESGMIHLGGGSLMLGDDAGFGKRESIADFSRVLSEMVDVVVIRSKKHATVVEVAAPLVVLGDQRADRPRTSVPGAGRPVHAQEHLRKAGRIANWHGSATATTWSAAWREGCGHSGVRSPCARRRAMNSTRTSRRAARSATFRSSNVTTTHDPVEAVGARRAAVYTDVWASMGQEARRSQRQADFADYQVNAEADVARRLKTALFMHCLPAHRGEEVTDEVIDGPTERRRGAGREPDARAEGHPGLAVGGPGVGAATVAVDTRHQPPPSPAPVLSTPLPGRQT